MTPACSSRRTRRRHADSDRPTRPASAALDCLASRCSSRRILRSARSNNILTLIYIMSEQESATFMADCAPFCNRLPWRSITMTPQARSTANGREAMRIGVPKEIKIHEYRVGLVPDAVRELTASGHQVLVQIGAGAGIACK